MYDFIRSDKRAQNDVDIQEDDIESELKEDAHNDLQNDKHYNTANVHFTTEVGWNLVASDVNLEEDAITYDSCMEVLDALKENRNGFEVISFLGTKVVGYKASELAEDFISLGKSSVSNAVLKQTASLFRLDRTFFDDAAFDIDAMVVKYSEVKKLASEISHCSDRAKNKVARKTLSRIK